MSKRKDIPTIEELELELKRERYRSGFGMVFKSTVNMLLTVTAALILVAVVLLPVFQIYGTSMNPTIVDGEFVVSVKNTDIEQGDIIGFNFNNKILVKRVIALPGQWVSMDKKGNVTVDDVELEEPYLQEKAYGECNIDFPYQVPDGRYFVMGDDREASVDSRTTTVGCVAKEQLLGKIIFRIWPINRIGRIQ